MSEGGPRYVKTGEGELPEVPYKHLVGSGDPDPKLRRAIEGKGLPAMEAFEKMVEMFVAAYRAGKPAVIEGATGSGKSMLTPLAIQEACRRLGISDRVVISQPRRDATQGVAEGVAALKREPVGKGVGWMTAERKCASEETDVIVMTTGVAKRWFFEGELTKEKVGAVMIDEVHECSVDVEMMTGSITRMFEKGVAPLVVLVSATLNRKEIEKHFALGEDQHVKVEGRSYPIETTYNPNNIPAPKEEKRAYLDQAADVVMQLCGNKSGARDEENEVSWVPKNTAGDILVFLPGAREIRDVEERVARSLVANDIRGFELCMYYGGLEQGERIRVMEMLQQKSEKRRIIIATNAAETSITFPHVETVVDTGVRRTARYDTHTGTTIQETTTISQDEANQRAGRAGRVAPGACIRLFSEEQFTAFPKHIEPEINRVNLANELLLLRSYGEDPETFPFMHPPAEGRCP